MPAPRPVPIFDGHNDALLRLYRRSSADAVAAFLQGEEKGQLGRAEMLRCRVRYFTQGAVLGSRSCAGMASS